jgi:hypothetical protein
LVLVLTLVLVMVLVMVMVLIIAIFCFLSNNQHQLVALVCLSSVGISQSASLSPVAKL